MSDILTVRDLCLWYGQHQALQNITIRIPEKSITALIGPSGCGKSTFLKTLNRMNDLIPGVKITGEVCYRGQEIGYLARLGERTVSIQYPRVERTLHGTGDVFASALCGALLSGAEAPAALERAAEFCNACVEKTAQRQPAHWYGLAFEDVLKERSAL